MSSNFQPLATWRPMRPVFAVWIALEIALFLAERAVGTSYAMVGVVSVGLVLVAAGTLGAIAARRSWPRHWLIFAVLLLVTLQFATALLVDIVWPAGVSAIEHGHFTVFLAFFLGTVGNLAVSILLAFVVRWALSLRMSRHHAS